MAEAHVMDEDPPIATAGSTLRRAREEGGYSLGEISERTKIPERHLVAIEQGNYAALPARAYAVGFSRTYARAVGLNDAEIAAMVRADLDGAPLEQSARATTFEPGDPARIPSSRFAWLAAGLVLAIIAAGFAFWRNYYSPAAELPPIVSETAPATPVAAAPAPVAAVGQEVVFTALQPRVWVKFSDASGAQLFQKELAQGETFTLPATANAPVLDTARPDALAITVGGRPVPKLAERQGTVRGVPVSAAALLGRTPPPAPPPATQAPPRSSPQPVVRQKTAVPAEPVPSPAPPAAASPPPAAPAAEPPPPAQ